MLPAQPLFPLEQGIFPRHHGLFSDGYKLRVEDVQKDVLLHCLVCVTFPIQPFLVCATFPVQPFHRCFWPDSCFLGSRRSFSWRRVLRAAREFVELSCGLGKELGGAIKWAKLGVQTINSFNYPAGCGQNGL